MEKQKKHPKICHSFRGVHDILQKNNSRCTKIHWVSSLRFSPSPVWMWHGDFLATQFSKIFVKKWSHLPHLTLPTWFTVIKIGGLLYIPIKHHWKGYHFKPLGVLVFFKPCSEGYFSQTLRGKVDGTEGLSSTCTPMCKPPPLGPRVKRLPKLLDLLEIIRKRKTTPQMVIHG